MKLAGQEEKPAEHGCTNQHGYAMAALIVAMGIMALMMTVVMPVWKQTAQREKEDELVFRGLQYVHAIGMYQRKFANAYPPNVDLLVEQRYLRKKYKDPITNDDFVVLPPGQNLPGAPAAPGQRGTAPGRGAGSGSGTGTGTGIGGSGTGTGTGIGSAPTRGSQSTTAPQPSTSQPSSRGGLQPVGSQPGGVGGSLAGVAGVTSKSKEQSIRLYNGRNHYNEWAFIYTPQLQPGQTGTTPPGVISGPQRGQQPGGPGGRGQQPGNDPFGRGRGNEPGQRGPSPFGPPQNPNNPPGGGRGFGPGPAQPIFPPTPRGR